MEQFLNSDVSNWKGQLTAAATKFQEIHSQVTRMIISVLLQ